MPKMMRLGTVERMLRRMGYVDAAEKLSGKLGREFKLHQKVITEVERRMSLGETVAIRKGGKGRHKVMFLNTEGFKPYNFQRPEILRKALKTQRARALA